MGRPAKKSDRDEAKSSVLVHPYPYHDARNPVLLADVVEGLLSGGRIFLSGGAGTGKTTLVRRIANQLVQRGKRVVLAASTGIAACQLRDETGIHNSRYCQGPSTLHAAAFLPRVEMPDSKRRIQSGRRKLKRADVVIVDEISMVDRITFDRFLERVEPETGLLVVGDFFQLPPVPRNEEGLPDFAFYMYPHQWTWMISGPGSVFQPFGPVGWHSIRSIRQLHCEPAARTWLATMLQRIVLQAWWRCPWMLWLLL